MLYADVILPFPLAQSYSYAVPDNLCDTLSVGVRVVVPFGQRRFYTGIVCRVGAEVPACHTIKTIVTQLDDVPIVRPSQLRFWQWIAMYYRCFLGDVYKVALPSALKLESETQVELSDACDCNDLTDKELHIVDALAAQGSLTIDALNKALDVKNSLPAIKKLFGRGVVRLCEEISEQYRPRMERFVRLADACAGRPPLELQRELVRSRQQQRLLLTYFEASPERDFVRKSDLLAAAGVSASVCKALVARGILHEEEQPVSRLERYEKSAQASALSDAQQHAYDAICQLFKRQNTVLLHGVTASGKTEIYMRLIADTLAAGKQVLYLVPEIALTTQLTERLKLVFGEALGVYHSKFSDAEHVELWDNLLGDHPRRIIIGARSALFLPFDKLGLVIVDEEHDASYKQSDTTPRYNARNAALVLAAQFGAKSVLGSATPSVESYCNALNGKYGLVELTSRYSDIPLPEIVPIDLTETYRKKQMTGHLSDFLVEKIKQTLEAHAQVILFQNRRGYAPYTECTNCGWTPRCPHCDVSLSYHKAFNKLTCHYCGYTQQQPTVCPDCGQAALRMHGFGTEQIEAEVAMLFPQARIGRMDLDTTRRKKAFENIIAQFERRDIDILIGTQMIAKGLDFGGVGLVGILNADNLLNYPDFRANERAFQMLTQVSGRAGRAHERGLVVLQTSRPEHPVVQEVIAGDYRAFFDREMRERALFHYPPYYRLLQIGMRHRDASTLNGAANRLAAELRRSFGERVFGPDNPPVGRVQNLFIKHILVKIEIEQSSEQVKQRIETMVSALKNQPEFRSLSVSFDIDL